MCLEQANTQLNLNKKSIHTGCRVLGCPAVEGRREEQLLLKDISSHGHDFSSRSSVPKDVHP